MTSFVHNSSNIPRYELYLSSDRSSQEEKSSSNFCQSYQRQNSESTNQEIQNFLKNNEMSTHIDSNDSGVKCRKSRLERARRLKRSGQDSTLQLSNTDSFLTYTNSNKDFSSARKFIVEAKYPVVATNKNNECLWENDSQTSANK